MASKCCACTEFPCPSVRTGTKERDSRGRQAPGCPGNPRWEQLAKLPRRHGRPWEGLRGPAAPGWEQRCPNSQHLRQCLPISGCPAETPFCSQALTLRSAQSRAVGLTKSMECPLPTAPGGGDAERHFYLQLEPDGLGKDSPPFHPDHWSTSKAAGAWPDSHERTQPVPSPVPVHQSPRSLHPRGREKSSRDAAGPLAAAQSRLNRAGKGR